MVTPISYPQSKIFKYYVLKILCIFIEQFSLKKPVIKYSHKSAGFRVLALLYLPFPVRTMTKKLRFKI